MTLNKRQRNAPWSRHSGARPQAESPESITTSQGVWIPTKWGCHEFLPLLPGGMMLWLIACKRDDYSGGPFARRGAADLHDGIEPGEGLALAVALRRIPGDCDERIGKIFRGRLPLQQFRHDHFV